MPKKRITIPKGYQDCDGGKCEKTQTFEIDIPDTKPIVETVPQVEIQGLSAPQVQQQQVQIPAPAPTVPEVPQPKTYTNEELSNLMPTGVNFAVCKGNNCADSKIQNKKLVTKFKQCPNCGCNNVPKNSNLCPCCGKDGPEDEEDYWEDSDIELKTKEEEEED